MRRFWQYRVRRTTLWLIVCVAFLAGIGLARLGQVSNPWWCYLALIAAVASLRKPNILTFVLVLLFGFSCGWYRGSVFMRHLEQYQVLQHQHVTLTAQAIDDGVYGKNAEITFDASNVQLADGTKLTGKIELGGFGLGAVFQGDEVQASGSLYPGFGAYQGSIGFAKLQIVASHPSLIAQVRRKFTAGVQSALPEPLAPFAMGLLVGQRATLPANIKQDLLMVGLTHIIAVSGYNLTIMLHASQGLFGKRSKRMSTFFSVALIFVFLLIAGSSASIIRAAIVSMLSIAAAYYGRSFKPLNLILLAATITAWANPYYVWSDTSWYLSFLAFFGVMVLSPLLQARWPHHWQETLIGGVALESICAEMMTLPFILHTFGQMSFIGLLANVLVVTLVPLAMLLSLFAGLAGMMAVSVCGWIAWPARFLLTYMLDIARVLAGIPKIFVQNLGLSTQQMIGLYVLLVLFLFGLWRKTKPTRYGKITDRIS